MFLQVKSVEHLEDYKLRLTFSNEIVEDVDLSKELYGEVFEPLRDVAIFQQVFLNPETNTIEWPNGADFAPEFLYDLGQPVSQIA